MPSIECPAHDSYSIAILHVTPSMILITILHISNVLIEEEFVF